MKKIVLFAAILTFTTNALAQDPELLANIWYAFHIEVDGITYNAPFSGDTPVEATFEFSTDSFATTTEDCSDIFGGAIEYDVPQQQFSFTSYTYLLAECTELIYPEFNSLYFNIFDDGTGQAVTFDYVVFSSGDIKKLVITNSEGDIAVYSNMLNTAPDPSILAQAWYLSSLEEDLGYSMPVADINPPMSPTISIAQDLSFISTGACNMATGLFVKNVYNSSWIIKNSETTNNTCEFSSHTNYDSSIASYLSNDLEYYVGIDNDSEPVRLFFTALNGFSMIYQETPVLSQNDILIETIQVYPNPVSETLFISSEGISPDRISVFNINGVRVLEASGETTQLKVDQLSSGIYFVEITSEGNRSIQKFIKN